jgi:hypothetical protein
VVSVLVGLVGLWGLLLVPLQVLMAQKVLGLARSQELVLPSVLLKERELSMLEWGEKRRRMMMGEDGERLCEEE